MSKKTKTSLAAFLGGHPLLGVFILTTICYFPTILLRDVTPANELRYLSIADEAIADGSLFTFSNHGIPYADKPPLYLWIVMLCRRLFGVHCLPLLSLFSYVPALVTVWLMDSMACRRKSPVERAALAMAFLSCSLFVVLDVFLRMDALMVMFIVAALYHFLRMYESGGNDRRSSYLFPIFTFLALFTKGPVGLLVPVLGVVVFLLARGEWRAIGKYLGWRTWAVLGGLSALWFSLTYAEGGEEYLSDLLFHQTMGRAVNSFAHDEPLLFYFPAILYTTIPWSLILVGTSLASLLRKTPGSGKGPRETLFLSVVFPTFVMLSLFSGKLPVYLAPIIPFMVWLIPLYLGRVGPWKERGRWMKWLLFIPPFLMAVLGAFICYLLVGAKVAGVDAIVQRHSLEEFSLYLEALGGHFVLSVVGLGMFTVGMAVASVLSFSSRRLHAPLLWGSGAMFSLILSLGLQMSSLNPLFGYGDLCRAVQKGSDVATIYLRRTENMDVFLGKSPADFGRNPIPFIEQEMAGRDFTLLTVTEKLKQSGPLRDFLQGRESFTVGRYTVFPALGDPGEMLGPDPPLPQNPEDED